MKFFLSIIPRVFTEWRGARDELPVLVAASKVNFAGFDLR